MKNQIVNQRENGFFSASIDSIWNRNDTLFAWNFTGESYSNITLKSHNLGTGYLSSETATTLNLLTFNRLQRTILSNYENVGYPFVNITLDSIEVSNDSLFASAKLFTGIKIVYDSIQIIGKSKLSKAYLSKFLDVEVGNNYREKDVKSIDKKLRNLPLVKLKGPSRVVFYRGLARILIDIDDIVTDRIDGIVGLAPNSSNSDANSLLITGEVNLELNNLFKSAKQLELHWRNYLQRSQLLDIGFTYPYLFNTKLGINGKLNLNKFDTIYVNLKSKLSFRYQQKGNNYIQFYYQNINSNLISVDTSSIRSQKKLPSNNPYNVDNYGLGFFQRDLDYLPNPRKGYHINADVSIGQKTILRNTLIQNVKYINTENGNLISIYDTMKAKSFRMNLALDASLFVPIKSSSVLVQKISFSGLFTEDILFNELTNFGGYSTLRGFDENELFASKLLSYLVEYRYLLTENSNVGLFFNTALIENTVESTKLIYDIPFGFGAVANIQVGSGILNLAYALGRQQNNPILLNTAKFHFGIVNYF
ncbi:MAG: outer membrane protein assembly factor [Bacteroidia bacterium]|nr:outer membrane protein assembly factor [Bacteroidia bacterium]